MTSDAHLNELGEFLKARRAELSPRTVGLPDIGGQRRVTGLRREEVAQLAGISTDRYRRLEQGRVPVPRPVLATLVRVLHLDDEQRDHLFELAGSDEYAQRRRPTQRVQPQLGRLLDELTETPALVMGLHMDILAWNALAAALLTDFGRVPEKKRNYVRLLFTDPGFREMCLDWRTVARSCVAQLRLEAAKCPGDPELAALVGELSVADADFRQWWAGRQMAGLRMGTKRLRHPVAGDLALDWNSLTHSADPAQQLVIWTAEPGSPSHEGLRFLASWAADPYQSAGDATASPNEAGGSASSLVTGDG
ncbi:helix-turn-helix transcriptional regulator (plasmid) [Streptomyces sp. NBC_01340]|uniref:helix-turn-helix transcriptional regulator n=1 Tax=unclassified Streptomyces TaxID=2593676 RepID=UPI00225BE6A0|nr:MULTISPECIES: helix-turn-helix transcriptional regulator [unclassified Streptomyces]MCX4461682.1 helix-turn-helix transcriptional regulator [Streptomyces sp. NBC_01719]MCX4490591.1 helix-turn-helix transcriptional regulator [Streptomyces sp. NBC_01728]WSI45650.1 helix-turn-helix transcriptional regulator [Streptomyces sp. NBC_01340]